MTILNDWGKKIGDAAGAAADKAKDFAEITRLTNDIYSEERQMNKIFEELGRLVFEAEKTQAGSGFREQIIKIKAHQEHIAAYNKRIQEIKGKEGSTMEPPSAAPKEADYIDVTPKAAAAPKAETSPKFCSNCGAELNPEGRFCSFCGTAAS